MDKSIPACKKSDKDRIDSFPHRQVFVTHKSDIGKIDHFLQCSWLQMSQMYRTVYDSSCLIRIDVTTGRTFSDASIEIFLCGVAARLQNREVTYLKHAKCNIINLS